MIELPIELASVEIQQSIFGLGAAAGGLVSAGAGKLFRALAKKGSRPKALPPGRTPPIVRSDNRRRELLALGGGAAAGVGLDYGLEAITGGGGGPTVPKSPAGRASAAMMGNLPLVLPVEYRAVAKPPRGYVTVNYNGQPVFMLKGCARDLGLWKAPPKPPISASDWRTLRRAGMVAKRVDRITKISDKVTGKKRTRTVMVTSTGRRTRRKRA